MKKNKLPWLLALPLLAPSVPVYAVTMTSNNVVGAAIEAFSPSGAGTSASPYLYDDITATLDMADYRITRPNTTSNSYIRLNLDSITYNTSGTTGGVFNLSGVSGVTIGSLRIDVQDSIRLNHIDTRNTANVNGPTAGAVTLNANNNIVLTGGVDATGPLGPNGASGAAISIISSAGIVDIGGSLLSSGGRGAGSQTVQGTSVYLNEVAANAVRDNASAASIGITATLGVIEAGNISATAPRNAGNVTLTAQNGNVTAGNITARSTIANDNIALSGGAVSITSGGAVQAGAIVTTVARTNQLNTATVGGAVNIVASNNVLVAGDINTFVNNSSTSVLLRSRGGNIIITSITGDITIDGDIDASSPAGDWDANELWSGSLTLSAAQGAIQLASLDVNKVGNISFNTSITLGTTILGAISGLDFYLDTDTMTVSRFGTVVGNIYYDPGEQTGELANGGTFTIVGSEDFSLTVVPEPGTMVMLTLGLAILAASKRKNRRD